MVKRGAGRRQTEMDVAVDQTRQQILSGKIQDSRLGVDGGHFREIAPADNPGPLGQHIGIFHDDLADNIHQSFNPYQCLHSKGIRRRMDLSRFGSGHEFFELLNTD